MLKIEGMDLNNFHLKWMVPTQKLGKNEIMGAVLDLPAN